MSGSSPSKESQSPKPSSNNAANVQEASTAKEVSPGKDKVESSASKIQPQKKSTCSLCCWKTPEVDVPESKEDNVRSSDSQMNPNTSTVTVDKASNQGPSAKSSDVSQSPVQAKASEDKAGHLTAQATGASKTKSADTAPGAKEHATSPDAKSSAIPVQSSAAKDTPKAEPGAAKAVEAASKKLDGNGTSKISENAAVESSPKASSTETAVGTPKGADASKPKDREISKPQGTGVASSLTGDTESAPVDMEATDVPKDTTQVFDTTRSTDELKEDGGDEVYSKRAPTANLKSGEEAIKIDDSKKQPWEGDETIKVITTDDKPGTELKGILKRRESIKRTKGAQKADVQETGTTTPDTMSARRRRRMSSVVSLGKAADEPRRRMSVYSNGKGLGEVQGMSFQPDGLSSASSESQPARLQETQADRLQETQDASLQETQPAPPAQETSLSKQLSEPAVMHAVAAEIAALLQDRSEFSTPRLLRSPTITTSNIVPSTATSPEIARLREDVDFLLARYRLEQSPVSAPRAASSISRSPGFTTAVDGSGSPPQLPPCPQRFAGPSDAYRKGPPDSYHSPWEEEAYTVPPWPASPAPTSPTQGPLWRTRDVRTSTSQLFPDNERPFAFEQRFRRQTSAIVDVSQDREMYSAYVPTTPVPTERMQWSPSHVESIAGTAISDISLPMPSVATGVTRSTEPYKWLTSDADAITAPFRYGTIEEPPGGLSTFSWKSVPRTTLRQVDEGDRTFTMVYPSDTTLMKTLKQEKSTESTELPREAFLCEDAHIAAVAKRLRFAVTIAENLQSASYAVQKLSCASKEEQRRRDFVAQDLLRRAALASLDAREASHALREAKTAAEGRVLEGSSNEYTTAVESHSETPKTFSVDWQDASKAVSCTIGIRSRGLSAGKGVQDSFPQERRGVDEDTITFALATSADTKTTQWRAKRDRFRQPLTCGASDTFVKEVASDIGERRSETTVLCDTCSRPMPSDEVPVSGSIVAVDAKSWCSDCLLSKPLDHKPLPILPSISTRRKSSTTVHDSGIRLEGRREGNADDTTKQTESCRVEAKPQDASALENALLDDRGVSLLEQMAAEEMDEAFITAMSPGTYAQTQAGDANKDGTDDKSEKKESDTHAVETGVSVPDRKVVAAISACCLFWMLFVLLETAIPESHTWSTRLPGTTNIEGAPSGIPRMIEAHPTFICITKSCIRQAKYLKSILSGDPCSNFYDYVCGTLTNTWRSTGRVPFSQDIALVSYLEDKALSYIMNATNTDVRIARWLLEDCTALRSTNYEEIFDIIKSYVRSDSWPLETSATDAWRVAGELARDLGIEAVFDTSIEPSPDSPEGEVVILRPPRVLFVYGDIEYVLDTIKNATINFLTPMLPNASVVQVALNIVDVARNISNGLSSQHTVLHWRLSPVDGVHPGVGTLLRTLYGDHLPAFVRSSEYADAVTQLVDEYPAAVVDYLVFWLLLYLAPYIGISELTRLFPLTLQEAPVDPDKHCSRAVERVLPLAYMRALSESLGSMTFARHWVSQVESQFLHGISRLAWLQGQPTDAELAKLRRRRVAHFFPVRATDKVAWNAYEKELRRHLANQSSSLGRLIAAARYHLRDNLSASAFATEVSYSPTRQFLYVPVGVVNISTPQNSSLYTFQMARFAVRIYRGLLSLMRPFSSTATQVLQRLYQCIQGDDGGAFFLEQTASVILAHQAFQQLLHPKRVWGADFRLGGLEELSSDQLFFVHFALDNCAIADDFSQRRQPTAEQRVNVVLRQIEAFQLAFRCQDRVVASRRCSVVIPPLD
ncbi:uncharacterized protein LOC135396088 isoform X2 [Ornithodoros turicata]|uniref:uncharacterized protein LOC135396088 isoform X2 n=1 Tax=Ornithodoros turicata TaxID=34597 RepID=UPI0031388B24